MEENKSNLKSILLTLILSLICICLSGFTIMNLWHWFIADYFHVIKLTFFESLGLSTFFGIFTFKVDDKLDTENKTNYNVILFKTSYILMLTFIVGWVIHLFM